MGAFPAPLQSEPPLKGNGIIDQSRGGSLCKEGHLVSPVPLAHSGTDAPPLIKSRLGRIPGPACKINDRLAPSSSVLPRLARPGMTRALFRAAAAAGPAGWHLTHRQGGPGRSARPSHFKVAALLARFTPEPISREIRRGLEMELRPHLRAGDSHSIPGKTIQREQSQIKQGRDWGRAP